MIFSEINLNNLYDSTVNTFPRTTKRQNSIDPIKIVEMHWTPFIGVKTLFIKGLAESSAKVYSPMILFKNVNYKPSKNIVNIFVNEQKYSFEELSKNDVMVRCSCLDFGFRGSFANFTNKCLLNKLRKKYESLGIYPPVNPENNPMMCKHIIKLAKALEDAGVVYD